MHGGDRFGQHVVDSLGFPVAESGTHFGLQLAPTAPEPGGPLRGIRFNVTFPWLGSSRAQLAEEVQHAFPFAGASASSMPALSSATSMPLITADLVRTPNAPMYG